MSKLDQVEGAASEEREKKVFPGAVLFVDLDGTLIASDLLWETLLLTLKNDPVTALKSPLWLLQGRAQLKRKLAEPALLTLSDEEEFQLPFRKEVIEFLEHQRSNGCRVVLATASDRLIVEKAVAGLDLFDDVLCSDGANNLKGAEKLKGIEAYCREHGFTEFGYIGDAMADVPIWKQASHVYAVAPGGAVQNAIKGLGKPTEVLVKRRSRLKYAIKSLRPHHWVKNLLIFVPFVLAHDIRNLHKLFAAIVAFAAFSLCASSIYLLNDMMDLASDRRHPTKSRRPFASGSLPLAYGPLLFTLVLALAFSMSLVALPLAFSGYLVLYLVLNYLYSTWLKSKLAIDVMVLAGLYSLRILAGGAAEEIVVSKWLLSFSMFFFLSLAFAKRHSELSRLALSQQVRARGRGYVVSDKNMIESMGPSSGYLAVLVLALYIDSPNMTALYAHTGPLWMLCPLLLYWINRVWLMANRGLISEDPVVFAVKDRVSLATGVISALLIMLASWGR